MGVAALAAGLLLALSVMPGCGSGCPTPEQRAYLEEVEDWSERSKTATRDFYLIVEEIGSRPETLIDEGWRGRLKRTFDELNSGHRDIIAIEPPAGAEETHRALVQAGLTYIEANEMFWQGVLDVDAETLDRSNARRREAIRLMEELIQVIERFCK